MHFICLELSVADNAPLGRRENVKRYNVRVGLGPGTCYVTRFLIEKDRVRPISGTKNMPPSPYEEYFQEFMYITFTLS